MRQFLRNANRQKGHHSPGLSAHLHRRSSPSLMLFSWTDHSRSNRDWSWYRKYRCGRAHLHGKGIFEARCNIC